MDSNKKRTYRDGPVPDASVGRPESNVLYPIDVVRVERVLPVERDVDKVHAVARLVLDLVLGVVVQVLANGRCEDKVDSRGADGCGTRQVG